jgi:hypothetical protein
MMMIFILIIKKAFAWEKGFEPGSGASEPHMRSTVIALRPEIVAYPA